MNTKEHPLPQVRFGAKGDEKFIAMPGVDLATSPEPCPHCENGPVVIEIFIFWGGGYYYFLKCTACGFQYTAIDDKEMEVEA